MKLQNLILLPAFAVLALLCAGCASRTTTTASTTTTTKKKADIYYTEDAPRTGSYIRRRYSPGAEPDIDSNLTTVRPTASSALSTAGSGTGLSDRGSGR